ncbi:MAG: DUF72 domain-containing protein [Ardenticatenales bacterium]|nr:DUF72 domain-containing protein [Ardenticatenales bacterium]
MCRLLHHAPPPLPSRPPCLEPPPWRGTFYALPSAETVRKWRETVPPGFHLCWTVPRAITHDRVLGGLVPHARRPPPARRYPRSGRCGRRAHRAAVERGAPRGGGGGDDIAGERRVPRVPDRHRRAAGLAGGAGAAARVVRLKGRTPAIGKDPAAEAGRLEATLAGRHGARLRGRPDGLGAREGGHHGRRPPAGQLQLPALIPHNEP